MSYQYAQYGEGFDLSHPSPYALSFEEHVQLHGETITIIQQTKTGQNEYGHPVYTETQYTEQGFIETSPDELSLRSGHIRQETITAYLRQWAPVEETLHEIMVKGHRYHIEAVEQTTAYLKVTAERNILD